MLAERQLPGRFLELATAGVAAYGCFLPLNILWRIGVYPFAPGEFSYALVVVATLLYLLPTVAVVVVAARGGRRRTQLWLLGAAAAVVLGTLPLVGVDWLGAVEVLAGLTLIVLPVRWSLPALGGFLAVAGVGTGIFGQPSTATYFVMGMLTVSPTLAIPVRLLARARELQSARLALAEQAVVSERSRIDTELGRTLGGALQTIAARAAIAAAVAEMEPRATRNLLDELVNDARATTAEARRMVRRYRRVSAEAELRTAASLLTAAGIETRLTLPPGPPLGTLPEPARARLQASVTRLLADGTAGHCVIEVSRRPESVDVDVRAEHGLAGSAR